MIFEDFFYELHKITCNFNRVFLNLNDLKMLLGIQDTQDTSFLQLCHKDAQ